ncbi:2-amino-4-hydroxy-6-hydroxymethyldihydropteridine diphosphokinase [Sneathiella sp. P13V-1]|uniref:2-amino-4-hydroxy-6- hydroxymethyldihydropteridine diphosphokinase n=1 Tax=Sneathiella sp. P13V-1 TaxID=2697366 RepID=UPI00187B1865|nr:2-amino-4-hydroxy-6-hydroxymethyldihydropteridine diphosphokinase [Sneathiella sp. P13V-1]MBE7638327.1 2-amino-4-hydroxy-6-hydroxymethyldihydropteridine diphosphokinase [Sneathiella sp. P13V-1]
MIFIGMGANLTHPIYGEPVETLRAALDVFAAHGLKVVRRSQWYKSAPVPMSDQPWFVNAVVEIETVLSAEEVLQHLHAIEKEFGRVREIKWEARVLDLDLLDFHGKSSPNKVQEEGGVYPHPYMHERSFVLVPLKELEPNWQHPILKQGVDDFLKELNTQVLQPFS